jgi:hypothetical protein
MEEEEEEEGEAEEEEEEEYIYTIWCSKGVRFRVSLGL